ncbi:hypothetical protein GmHk_19G054568 [Glycine max]|nr:hypothetical protein GmHk_19G054568 [Glycine max]
MTSSTSLASFFLRAMLLSPQASEKRILGRRFKPNTRSGKGNTRFDSKPTLDLENAPLTVHRRSLLQRPTLWASPVATEKG